MAVCRAYFKLLQVTLWYSSNLSSNDFSNNRNIDKACVGESTRPDNVFNSIVQKYKLKRNFKDDIDLNSFILNLIHTIISFTTTDLRYLSIWIGEHFVRTSVSWIFHKNWHHWLQRLRLCHVAVIWDFDWHNFALWFKRWHLLISCAPIWLFKRQLSKDYCCVVGWYWL